MLPSDVPTNETLAFIRRDAPPPPARLLEVGCGDGALAARLQALGYLVIAIDSNTDAVAKAQRRGVQAEAAKWPEFGSDPFDAILFTRSLHHIHPLPEAVRKAKELLKPDGIVLIEDFTAHEIEPLAAQWVYQVLALLEAGGHLRRDADAFAEKILKAGGAPTAWQAGRDHELHSAQAIDKRLREHFGDVQMTTAPYLYRYVCGILEDTPQGYDVAARVLGLERSFMDASGLPFVGRRWRALIGR